MQRAVIYKRKQKYLIHSSSKTTAGVWILEVPVYTVNSDNSEYFIDCLLKSLEASRQNVVHPSNWSNLFIPVLEAAGVKSYKTFVKNTTCVEIEKEDDSIIVTPTKNLGANEGFEPKANDTLTINKQEKLFDIVFQAFSKSE